MQVFVKTPKETGVPSFLHVRTSQRKNSKNEVACSTNHDTPGNYRDFLFKEQAPLVAMSQIFAKSDKSMASVCLTISPSILNIGTILRPQNTGTSGAGRNFLQTNRKRLGAPRLLNIRTSQRKNFKKLVHMFEKSWCSRQLPRLCLWDAIAARRLSSESSKDTQGAKAFEHQDIAAEDLKKLSSHVRKIMMVSAITETLSLRSNRSSAMIFRKFERYPGSQDFLNVTTSHRKNGNMDITFS